MYVYTHMCACPIIVCTQSCPTFVTPRTVARQAPLSMEFSRQEYWKGLPFPTPGDHPEPGVKPSLLLLLYWQADSLPLHHWGSSRGFQTGIK